MLPSVKRRRTDNRETMDYEDEELRRAIAASMGQSADFDLEMALAASLADANRPALSPEDCALLSTALKLQPAASTEHELTERASELLKQRPNITEQLQFLCGVQKAVTGLSPAAQAKLNRLGLEVLMGDHQRFADLGAFGGLQRDDKAVVTAVAAMQASHKDFVDGLFSEATSDQRDKIFGPVLFGIANSLMTKPVDSPEVLADLASIGQVLQIQAGRDSFMCLLRSTMGRFGRDFEVGSSIVRCFGAAPSLAMLDPRIPGHLGQLPAHAAELATVLPVKEMAMSRIQAAYLGQVKLIVKDKQHKEQLLSWLGALWQANMRRDGPGSSFTVALNLTSVLMNLCKPFLAPDAAAHQQFSRLDYRWIVKRHRIDFRHENTLGLGATARSNASAAGHMNFEIDTDEAAEIAEAIRMSLGEDEGGAADAAAEQPDLPDEFHFVTDTFFLTLAALHAAFVPGLDQLDKLLRMRQDWLSGNGNLPQEELMVNAQFRAFEMSRVHHQIMLANKELMVTLAQLCVLESAWLEDLATKPDARQAFDALPEFIVRDLGRFITHCVVYAPDVLCTTRGVERVFSFLGKFVHPDGDLIRSAIVRQGLVDVLHMLVRGQASSGRRPAGELQLFERLMSNTPGKERLLVALLHQFVAVGYVDEATEVFDKNMARVRTGSVLRELCSAQWNRLALHEIAKSEPIFQSFVQAALSDAVFLMNDAFSRLNDVKGMQEFMADTAALEALSPQDRDERVRYFHQVERTAKGFLSMALETIDLLLFSAQDAVLRSLWLQGPHKERVAQTLDNFLTKLCGDRLKELKVKDPQKYGWDPKRLLLKIGEVTAGFAQEPGFTDTLVSTAEDVGIFPRAEHLLRNRCGAGRAVQEGFQAIIAACASVASSNAATEAGSSSSPDGSEILGPVREDDSKDVDCDDLGADYAKALLPFVFGEAKLSDRVAKEAKPAKAEGEDDDDSDSDSDSDEDESAGTYNDHHFNSNIIKASARPPKNKITRLIQEHKSLTPDLKAGTSSLPLAPGASVFLCRDEDRMDVFKVIISGPVGTPYSGGLFEFHVFVPDAYPEVPPLINLETTGGNQFRFNPNLYSCGKVCLSLLGTWHGGARTSGWQKETSTLLQVFVSIQSLIMVEHPYFNEPGYESQLGTEVGMRKSERYSDECRCQTIRLAMVDMLRNPPKGFEAVVHRHFALLGDRIVEQCCRWARLAHARAKEDGGHDWGVDMEKQILRLKDELAKLPPLE